tara:strand:- start:2071 stop:2376 length:306 start_codon:yes stop_codon:yes gene_type:complete
MPRVNFYWIMGADSLENMHKWHNWKKIFYLCPILVLNRSKYFYKALNSKTSKYFWKKRIDVNKINRINKKELPVWCFLNIKPNYMSSTIIRKKKGYSESKC